MQSAKVETDHSIHDASLTSRISGARLAIGAMQGLMLYFLYHSLKTHAWPADHPYVISPLIGIFLLVPPLLVCSLGNMKHQTAALWCLVSATVIGLLGLHDAWRKYGAGEGWLWQSRINPLSVPSFQFILFSAIGFYIAHALVLSGTREKRFIATYATYFETAWKLTTQLVFSFFFTAVLWLVLWLGSALFLLVKLKFLNELIQESWFAIPVTCFAFSCALHVTDVRPSIVSGIRTLKLTLLSALLPVATLLVSGFLLELPVKGLAPLWETRHAASILLTTSALLILLLNSTLQGGTRTSRTSLVLGVSSRIAAFLLLPLTAIAIYALALRVGDYGWTADRVNVAACLFIALCYAAGYAWSACHRRDWHSRLAKINILVAFLTLGALIAVFSPIADPARISVNSQVARLSSGKVAPEKFDFDYLKREGQRYGIAALERLKNQAEGKDAASIREQAELALKKERSSLVPPARIDTNIKVWPSNARLPASFLEQNWRASNKQWSLPACMKYAGQQCDAYLLDMNMDGKPEILIIGTRTFSDAFLMMEDQDHHWKTAYRLPSFVAGCDSIRKELRAGNFRIVEPRMKDLEVAGQRIELMHEIDADDKEKCPPSS